MLYKLLGLCTVLVLLLVVMGAVILWLLHRKPDLVVVDNTTGKAVVLNNREVGEGPAVRVLAHQLTEMDRFVAAKRFLSLRYQFDNLNLASNVKTALEMAHPAKAGAISNYWIKGDGKPGTPTLGSQKAENWQAVWTPQTVMIDAKDRNLVHVIGVQRVTRIYNNQQETFEVQYQFHVKLIVDAEMKEKQDGNPRAERNFSTGFLVLEYTGEEIKNPAS